MRTILDNMIYRLGAKRFVDQVVDDLLQRRNVILVITPDVNPRAMWAAIRGELCWRGVDVDEIELEEYPSPQPAHCFLAGRLGVRRVAENNSLALTDLAASLNLPEIVWLHGISTLPSKDRQLWLEFLENWAKVASLVEELKRYRPVFCVPFSGAYAAEAARGNDLRLVARYWWTALSALDTRLLCRLVCDDSSLTPKAMWRENLIPSIAASDLDLVEILWEPVLEAEEGVFSALRDHAKRRQWKEEYVESCSRDLGNVPHVRVDEGPIDLPERLIPYWAAGLLQVTPEHGIELNSAALCMVSRDAEVRHRLWRGQATLILPVLDETRLSICRRLTLAYGADWPYQWMKPRDEEEAEAVREDPFACQFGHLETLLRNCRKFESERHWLGLIEQARFLRNELAHYRPVHFTDFIRFWELSQEIGNTN
jgi:hypothetical protein